jgi:uncharacterized heparinase superfamily protein
MLRVDDSRSLLIERFAGSLDRGVDYAASFGGLGRYLMPRFRVTGLALPIVPLLPGNADLAGGLYRNRFLLAGTEVSGGTASIFAAPPPSEAWAGQLHGFAWLTHLAAGGLEMHRAFARTLIGEWTERHHPRIARTLLIRASRVKAAVHCAPFLLAGAARSFRNQFFRMAARDVAVLSVASPPAEERLRVAIALACAATSFEGLEGLKAAAFERLEAALAAEILADGGHVSRNPARLVELLVDLLPLRSALSTARQALPRGFNAAIERMLPMVRFFAHGDDGLAAFQGVASPMTRELRAVLAHDTTLGRPLSHAPHSGYARLAQGAALAIADIGNDALCASPLAFEFSDGPHRIVVNCGMPSTESGKWLAAARQQAAHSTATPIDCDLPAAGGFLSWWFRQNPRMPRPRATGRVTQSEHGVLLRAIDHAFAGRSGDLHERDIFLSGAGGGDVRGEDRFLDGGSNGERRERSVAIRFHIHPSVKATPSQDGTSIMLILPNKSGWRFSAKGGSLSLEESVYLLGAATPRNTQQIVIRGRQQINWAFKRIDKRNPKLKDEFASPELPL